MSKTLHCKEDRDGMFSKNQGLVIKIALSLKRAGDELEELVLEGNVGLLKAINRFNPKKGFRFSTFAYHYIRAEILKFKRSMMFPVYVAHGQRDFVNRYNRERLTLKSVLGKEPDRDDVLENCGSKKHRKNVTELAMLAMTSPVYLDGIPFGEDEGPRQSLVETEPSTHDRMEQDEVCSCVREVVTRLNSRLARILFLRYGLGSGGREMTLERVGRAVGLTRERVRQLEQNALKLARTRLYKLYTGYPPCLS